MPTAPTQRRSLPLWAILVAGIAFVVVWAVLFRLLPTPSLEPTKRVAVGKPLPLLELQPLTGASDAISLNDIQGKVALINYWGTWCPPCVMEFPHMAELWNRHRDEPGFAFLSISSTFDDHEDLPAVREATENFLKLRKRHAPNLHRCPRRQPPSAGPPRRHAQPGVPNHCARRSQWYHPRRLGRLHARLRTRNGNSRLKAFSRDVVRIKPLILSLMNSVGRHQMR